MAPAARSFDDEPTTVDIDIDLDLVAALPPVHEPAPEAPPPARSDAIPGWSALRTAPLCDGLPNEALRTALLAGRVRVSALGRDELLPRAEVVLVRRGQLALARFAPEVLDEERRAAAARAAAADPLRAAKHERKRRDRVGPLASRAAQNLAVFEDGDLFLPGAAAPGDAGIGGYSVTPAEAILFDRELVDTWARVHGFFADRLRRALAAARARVEATDGAQAAVADFAVRHGLSVSMTLRVRRLDACVECGACERACAERYGVKRLSLDGRILGGLDFVDACHTCSDARCIDPCNFDAIRFDAARKEVVILEDACTGCTLCARACPYDAIEMHELDEHPGLVARLDREGKLGFGEGTPRKARLRRLASKCDHCVAYADQACISACPTGALLELAPSDVVPSLPAELRASARAGFDDSVAIDVGHVNSPAAFVDGPEVPELGRARAPRTRLVLGLWWTLGLAAVLLAGTEILLRKLWPSASLAYLLDTQLDHLDPDVALLHVDYKAGCTLAVDLGYAGSALLATSLAYVLRKRLGVLRHAGALQAWFDWHVVASVIGAALIALHTAARLDNWVAVPFWAMIGAVASGLVGRYLATRLPAGRAALEVLELERELARLRVREPGLRAASRWLERDRARLDRRLVRRGLWGALAALGWLVVDDLGRGARLRRLRRELRRAVPGWRKRATRREAARLAEAVALGERRRALVDPLLPLFLSWKAVHVPMATLLTLLGALHIAISLAARH